MATRERYCQRCGELQALTDLDQPRPCRKCGGTQFDGVPPRHSRYLTDDDRIFLRIQGIKPDDDEPKIKFSW